MPENTQNSEVADNLKRLVEDTLTNKCNAGLTEETAVDEREIVEYDGRMRVGSLEKFNGPCYTVGFNLFTSEDNEKRGVPAGTLIYFVDEDSVERLLKSLEFRGFDEEDQGFVIEHLGQFFKSVSEDYAERVGGMGYGRLMVSEPTASKNNLPDGMSIPYDSTHYHELSFHFWKKKSMVVDVVMSSQ